MGGVFFSYAEEDSDLAILIHNALGQAKVDVWCYQVDGKKGALITDELRKEITKAQYFCLLDSSHSRKSNFVREECRLAREVSAVRSDFRMIVCLIEKAGDWRNEELFEQQNSRSYIDFNDYENGMAELYIALEIYTPFCSVPRDEDFRIEIEKCKLPVLHKSKLASLYTAFTSSYADNRRDVREAEVILKILMDNCTGLGVNMITLHIASGVLLADAGRDQEALERFSIITQEFENDPRGWAGVGAAQFHLFNYESALQAYEHCHRLILESNSAEHQSHLMEVAHNKARVLLELGNLERAIGELNKLPASHQRHHDIQCLRGEILMKRGDWLQAISCLEAAYNQAASPAIIVNLAECYKMTTNRRREYEILQFGMKSFPEDTEILENLAGYFLEAGHPFAALSYLQKAISISPEIIQYKLELALILRRIGDDSGFYNQLKECTKLYARSSLEHYYLEYALYLLREFEGD